MPAPRCPVQLDQKMVPEVQGGMLAPPCMDHRMCSWPGRWYRSHSYRGVPSQGSKCLPGLALTCFPFCIRTGCRWSVTPGCESLPESLPRLLTGHPWSDTMGRLRTSTAHTTPVLPTFRFSLPALWFSIPCAQRPVDRFGQGPILWEDDFFLLSKWGNQ